MMLLLWLFCIEVELVDTISLPDEFNTIVADMNYLYLAPFAGTSLYQLMPSERFDIIQFTDNVNYRIVDFAVTPFAVYLNNGTTLHKYYFNSGTITAITTSSSISAFTLSGSEEIVFANGHAAEVSFLDFTSQVRFVHTNMRVLDLIYTGDNLYCLLGHRIVVLDEHGNMLDTLNLPEYCTRLSTVGEYIIAFSPGKTSAYLFHTKWHKIEFVQGVRDIAGHKGNIVVLRDDGSTLSIYRITDF